MVHRINHGKFWFLTKASVVYAVLVDIESHFVCFFIVLVEQGPKVQQKTKEQKLAAALAGGKAKKKVSFIKHLTKTCLNIIDGFYDILYILFYLF